MATDINEIISFIKENDVKFIRLAFCDLTGRQKNISIMPDELNQAFDQGISFDAHAIMGFKEIVDSDLFLVPDASTMSVLPWRPQQGRVVRFYCSIRESDGRIFNCDSRSILSSVLENKRSAGYDFNIGAECEFYLFKTDENGEPTTEPFDKGGYLDVYPLDRGENIRREICLCLEEMGIAPESSHHEQGPGQNEIDFKFSDPLTCADNLMTFKTTVRTIAARNGLFASFSPKPLPEHSGSGLHINISYSHNGRNPFRSEPGPLNEGASAFIAGILDRVPEITAFLDPIPNSYERFGAFEAPKYISWSHSNRSQLIRIPAASGDKMRMELRSPDPSLNPYLAFALVISAGVDGIERMLSLPSPADIDLENTDISVTEGLNMIPSTFGKALELAQGSDFVMKTLGRETVRKYIDLKSAELSLYLNASNTYQHFINEYFRVI